MDHSSVTSSPRLIAGSYVLHRLLVPRHPPCALNNLTTKTQRCSRPLCSSQHTSSTTPCRPTPTPPPTRKQESDAVCGPGADHQKHHTNQRRGLSGPNSVPDTQPATTHPTFPPPHPHPHPRRSTRHEHDSCTSEAASHRRRASNPLTFHP